MARQRQRVSTSTAVDTTDTTFCYDKRSNISSRDTSDNLPSNRKQKRRPSCCKYICDEGWIREGLGIFTRNTSRPYVVCASSSGHVEYAISNNVGERQEFKGNKLDRPESIMTCHMSCASSRLKMRRNCEDIARALIAHRERHHCKCNLVYLKTGIPIGCPRFATLCPHHCWTGFWVRRAMKKHARVCALDCLGQYLVNPWPEPSWIGLSEPSGRTCQSYR